MAVNRITGMVSGMDTDKLISDLMKIERAPYEKLEIEKQYTEWRQSAYRTTMKTIDGFQSKYFDILNQENYLMSPSSFAAFTSKVTVNGEDKKYITVEGTADANDLTHTISSISQLASEDKWHSATVGASAINSTAITASTITDLKTDGLSFMMSIDGVTKEIKVVDPELAAINTTDDLVSAINTQIANVFGSEYNDIVSKQTEGSDDIIRFDKAGSHVALFTNTGSSTLSKFGIDSGASNESYKSQSLETLFGFTDDDLNDFKINGTKIENLSKDDTLDEFMEKINQSEAGVQISFDTMENRFLMVSEKTGSVNNIDFSDSADASNVFAKLGFQDTGGDGSGGVAYREKGQNAVFVLDGQTVVKQENSFLVEGIKYTLNETYTGADPIDVSLTNNVDDIVDKIKGFVEDYNTLITTLRGIVNEPVNRDYEPLTSEQKSSLSEDEIEKWETQAKKGLLKGDDAIEGMLDAMRTAIYEPVEGAGRSVSSIGITTSSNYKDGGKLVINEEKLRDAIENDFDSVVKLFTKESDADYLESGRSGERYKENGLMSRLDDIMSDVIRTNRDTNGNKGSLVEKAGLVGDGSVTTNALSKQLLEYESKMKTMLAQLSQKEQRFYLQFSRMETALSQLQAQSSSLVSTFGG